MEKKPKWEHVAEYTYRLCVPAGWLYRYTEADSEPTMVFVPCNHINR